MDCSKVRGQISIITEKHIEDVYRCMTFNTGLINVSSGLASYSKHQALGDIVQEQTNKDNTNINSH